MSYSIILFLNFLKYFSEIILHPKYLMIFDTVKYSFSDSQIKKIFLVFQIGNCENSWIFQIEQL